MSWFWGKKNDDDEEEYSEEEYYSDEFDSSEEFSDDEYISDDEEEAEVEEEEKIRIEGASAPTNENDPVTEPDARMSDDDDLETTDDEDDFREGDDESSSYESSESSYEDDDEEESEDDDEVLVETVAEEDSSDSEDDKTDSDEDDDDDDDDDDEEITSFWEKQSLLVLAAEHDRVDILNAILTDNNGGEEDKDALMNSGIPPLHVAISFGSTNATQSLLRMGADPSVRPNNKEIQSHSEQSKVEIKNMERFDGVTGWELAFGNQHYEETKQNGSSGWSLFRGGGDGDEDDKVIIKPVDMAPSKLEGIRHAFTAESLRCIGGDEVDRLRQLLNSGMPPTIDIGGKDLYGWAVEMGALKCEEVLRPSEAAKHATEPPPTTLEPSKSRVLDRSRPGEETTVPHLMNRLDELESLASALSTCLDNLAEEVSVCHGLLLIGGGASALASHVKSLKTLKQNKSEEFESTQVEWEEAESELVDLIQSAGHIGEEVSKLAPASFLEGHGLGFSRTESSKRTGTSSAEEEEAQKRQLTAQLAASENKIRKLRASIADLSDESTRALQEVERRGLSGGINLVRGLREDIRDIDFQISEAKSMKATCRAKIALINSRLAPSKKKHTTITPETVVEENQVETPNATTKAEMTEIMGTDEKETTTFETADSSLEDDQAVMVELADVEEEAQSAVEKEPESIAKDGNEESQSNSFPLNLEESRKHSLFVDDEPAANPEKQETSIAIEEKNESREISLEEKTASERIATGDSQALSVRPSGRQGYFTLDMWQVLLRIFGFDRAAIRRGVQVANQQPASANLMIV